MTVIDPSQYTGARVLRSTHDKIRSLSRKGSAVADRDVSIRELYSALAELGERCPEDLNAILISGRFQDGD